MRFREEAAWGTPEARACLPPPREADVTDSPPIPSRRAQVHARTGPAGRSLGHPPSGATQAGSCLLPPLSPAALGARTSDVVLCGRTTFCHPVCLPRDSPCATNMGGRGHLRLEPDLQLGMTRSTLQGL